MALDGISALIVDDNAHMRGLLRVILAGFGMRKIEEAESAGEGLQILAAGDIDIAFVDLKLGGLDGLEFCRHIRTHANSPNIYLPLIMVTAYGDEERRRRAKEFGAAFFIIFLKHTLSVDSVTGVTGFSQDSNVHRQRKRTMP